MEAVGGAMRIMYDSKKACHKSPFGTLTECEACKISLHVPKDMHADGAKLLIECENGDTAASFAMSKCGGNDEYDVFSCTFALALSGLYFYFFSIECRSRTLEVFRDGFDGTSIGGGGKWQLSCIPKDFSTPDSFVGGVMYQIFPDRFCRAGECDTSEKLMPFRTHRSAADVPDYKPDQSGEITNSDFFGGNFRGILSKLDYLASLGVNIIYLNPIFKAYSNHRYDTCDYRKPDEMLGTEADFSELCGAAHARGIRVILDGVFSHTGARSIYFDAEKEFGTGAVSSDASPYRSWYSFSRFPDKYDCWWGLRTLPSVNENDPSYVAYQITDDDSTLAKWMKLGADGWRLDVADELFEEFILCFRRKMKELCPQSLLIGEVWEDASSKISYGKRRGYFTRGELDSVMNYPVRGAVIDFVLGHDDGTRFRETVLELTENYPPCVTRVLMNFISTHDTPRALTVLSGVSIPDKDKRAQFRLSHDELDMAKKRLLCAYLTVFSLPGIPSVYYGDEIGTEGFEDPFCRGFYDWDKESELTSAFASFAALRKLAPFACGKCDITVETPGVVTVTRELGERFDVTVNCSRNRFTIRDCGCGVHLSRGAVRNGQELVLDEYGYAVIKRKSGV